MLPPDPGGDDARTVDAMAAVGGLGATTMNPLRSYQLSGHPGGAAAHVIVTSSDSRAPQEPSHPVVLSDQAQGPLARLTVVSSSGSSPDPHGVTCPAVTDVADVADAAVKLAEVHERLAAAQGNITAARTAFQRGLADIKRFPLPYERAMLELAYGQVLRRAGQRRAAASQLQLARDRLVTLNARPALKLCDRELAACGLAPAKRSEFDPRRLTAQELAVAGLVATGISNREVATELFVSIKTVQFHLTHIYAKLGINSRAELAAQFRGQDTDKSDREQRSMLRRGAPSSSRVKQPHSAAPRSRTRPVQRQRRQTPKELTPQESAVAGLVATGMGNREVATELFVSIKTVQFHLTHIYAKLGINSRGELAAQFRDLDTNNTDDDQRETRLAQSHPRTDSVL